MPNEVWTFPYDDLIEASSVSGVGTERRNLRRVWPSAFVAGSMASDFTLIFILSITIFNHIAGISGGLIGDYVSTTLCVALVSVALFKNNHLYKIEMFVDPRGAMKEIFKIWSLLFLSLATVSVLTKTSDQFSRVWFLTWFFCGLFTLSGFRFAFSALYRRCVRRGLVSHSVVVVGASRLTAAFLERIRGNKFGVKVDAIFDDDTHAGQDQTVDIDGDLNDLLAYQKSHEIDTVVVALPMADNDRLRHVIRRLSINPVKIRILLGELALASSHKSYAPFGEIPGVQLMAISDRPIALWGHVAKTAMDRLVALLALIVFGPLMIACVIGIKLNSQGPILFRQKRIGYRNQIFEVYKFRSMHNKACDAGYLTTRNDPRVFGFGQFMRKLSLDELPQLFNVLKGDMSLVGPRPHMPDARAAGRYYYDVVSEYAYRHRVKPGITGWAQVNGWRGPTETVEQIEERVRYDLYYIDNWSLGLDIAILLKTLAVGFFGKNAF